MSKNAFNLDLVTPEKSLFSGEVISITAPSEYGSFQVLKDHAPMLSALGEGEIKLVLANKEEQTFNVKEGFFEVSDNKVILLAENIM